jgi:UDP-glucuronate 4-epimerase
MAAEHLCVLYAMNFGVPTSSLRYFTVYGPRQRPEMAIHLFADNMLEGEPITIFGDGKSSRDYTYIDDIIRGVVASVERCSGFEIINLGGSKTTSLDTLVALLGKQLGVSPKIQREAARPGDVPVTYADVTRAKQLLGYVPKTDIEEGIDRFCKWLKAERERTERGLGSLPSTMPLD